MAGSKPFTEMPEISPSSLAILDSLGYVTATPVQEASIPLFCGNKDVAVDACTGSGKTLAFVVPLVERLRRLQEPLRKHQIGAIIVSPTRELAQQILQVAAPFLATVSWAKPLLLVGGRDPAADVASIEADGANVLVGTPGRITDVMDRSQVLDFRRLELLVLDEADRLLDLGFKEQLDRIFAHLPRQRRTGLFSATQTEAVQEMARAGLRNPIRVKVAVRQAGESKAAAQRTPLGLSLFYRTCESSEKLAILTDFLQEHRTEKVIVYALTCAFVDLIAAVLPRLPHAKGLRVAALHGRMKQSRRQATLNEYAAQKSGCLLCTDVAARGLDIPNVDWILQLDPPQNPDAFVHRVGRTARMGRSGSALALLLPHETPYIEFLRRRKIPLTEASESGGPVQDFGPYLRRLAEGDRDVLEKGIRAFVSYIRGYKEHQCRFIFRSAELDLGRLAHSCGLLQLPRMPEIRKLRGRVPGFEPSIVNPNEVKFLDKARQKVRERMLREKAEQKAVKEAEQPPSTTKRPHQDLKPEKRVNATKRRLLEHREDELELEDDYRLLKRLRRGKMTRREYDIASGFLTEDSGEEAEAIADNEAVMAASAKVQRESKEGSKRQPKSKHMQSKSRQNSKAVHKLMRQRPHT